MRPWISKLPNNIFQGLMNICTTRFPSPAGSGCWNINVKVVAELFSPFKNVSLPLYMFHNQLQVKWEKSLRMNTGKNTQNIKINNISRSGERISTTLSWDALEIRLRGRFSVTAYLRHENDKARLKMSRRLHHQVNILSRSRVLCELLNRFSPAHGFFRTID